MNLIVRHERIGDTVWFKLKGSGKKKGFITIVDYNTETKKTLYRITPHHTLFFLITEMQRQMSLLDFARQIPSIPPTILATAQRKELNPYRTLLLEKTPFKIVK